MKKILITLSLFAITLGSMAQKHKEVGINFSSMDNFGLSYKTGGERAMWRFSTFVDGTALTTGTDADKIVQGASGLGAAIGFEFNRPLSGDLSFRWGSDLFANTTRETRTTMVNSRNVKEASIRNQRGFNLVLGLNYLMNEKFVLGFEVLPSVTYTIAKEKVPATLGNQQETNELFTAWSYGLNTNWLRLTAAFRF